MPFESLAQEGFMHEHPEILGKEGLKEWDEATKGEHLPKRKKRAPKSKKPAVIYRRTTTPHR